TPVTVVAVTAVGTAVEAPVNVTADTPSRFFPVIVNDVPTGPLVGKNDVMAGGGSRSNRALTVWATLIVTGHVRFIVEQGVLHPPKVEPAAASAWSVTIEPKAKLAIQMVPQSMPDGMLRTVPWPAPVFVTVSGTGSVTAGFTICMYTEDVDALAPPVTVMAIVQVWSVPVVLTVAVHAGSGSVASLNEPFEPRVGQLAVHA